jgi:hypothetical protein
MPHRLINPDQPQPVENRRRWRPPEAVRRALVRSLLILLVQVILLWPLPAQTVSGTDGAPRVEQHRITSQAAELHVGTPFRLEVLVTAPEGTRWTHPDLPVRVESLTWQAVTIRSLADGRYEIILHLQAFQTGPLALPDLPIVAELPSGENRPLPLPPVEVTIGRLTDSAPGTPRPIPPRVFLDLPGSGWLFYLLSALGLMLGLVILLIMRRRRPAGPPVEVPAEPPDLQRFLKLLEDLWTRRERLGDDRLLAFGMMAIFRDYLSWRHERDFHSWTNLEIVDFLQEQPPLNAAAIDQLRDVLEEGDQIRFSPSGGTPFSLFSALRDLMERMGEKSGQEAVDAGVPLT